MSFFETLRYISKTFWKSMENIYPNFDIAFQLSNPFFLFFFLKITLSHKQRDGERTKMLKKRINNNHKKKHERENVRVKIMEKIIITK